MHQKTRRRSTSKSKSILHEYFETMLADSVISGHFRDNVDNPRLVLTLYDWTFFYFILNSILNSYFKTSNFGIWIP
jgi:hypothetical protein